MRQKLLMKGEFMGKKWNLLSLAFLGAALLLELYPRGAVVSRIAAPGEHFLDYFSYFSLTPYWSENQYPLRTGILSFVFVILILLKIWKGQRIRFLDVLVLVTGGLVVVCSGCAAHYQYENAIAYTIMTFLVFSFLSVVGGMLTGNDKT